MKILPQLKENLSDHLIVFVAKDFNRGVGIEKYLPHYLIVCGTDTDAIDLAQKDGLNIFCLSRHTKENTHNAGKILESELSQNHIKETAQKLGCDHISVFGFKGTSKIEFICKKNGWNYLNLDSKLTRDLEEKANFESFLKTYTGPMLPTISGKLKDLNLENLQIKVEKYAVQMTHGFAGMTTHFIDQKEFKKFQETHPENKVKITPFITGETLTLNGCIYRDLVYVSYPFLQKTGLPEYSRHPGGSCGVVFDSKKVLKKLVTLSENPEEIIKKTVKTSQEMAEIFKEHGLRGFFGFDLITDGSEVYPIELNPRLTANIHPFTEQQNAKNLPPFLLLHILEFLNINIDTPDSEQFLHQLKGETLALRNVTDSSFALSQPKQTNGYSFAQLLKTPELKEILTASTNGTIVEPDERWGEMWSI